MKTIFDTCVPRNEVLKGELREQEFAASLTKVLRGDADTIYSDAAAFFANTYLTAGLQSLLAEAMGRINGTKKVNAPVIRLETSFGGGKTHNLIALFHVCHNGKQVRAATKAIPADLIPGKPLSKIAGIVGNDLGVAEGVDYGDVKTLTLWGELAYQLGGRAAYQQIQQDDHQRTDPGTKVWEKLIGDEPALILIDELPAYLRKAKGVQVGKTTLADQTVAFFMSLMKFVAESKHAVLVYTLADSSDAFGREADEVRQELAEARSVSARQEHVLTPTAENEISAIVSHRLFHKVDRKAAEEIADEFLAYYRKLVDQNVDLPTRATRSEYRQEIAVDYPFHPELLTTLNRKTSTIPNFQKTRGILRLLALVVRDLWAQRPKDCCLIAPHHLNLGLEQLANDLTSRLDRPAFKQVVEADIVSPRKGSLSHAQELDREWIDAGKPPYAQRVATTAFMHSIVQSGQNGVDPADMRLAVLEPGDDPALIDKAAQRLVDTCWFFDYDGIRYRFKTEPSLRKIVDDEMGMVGKVKAKSELDERIRKVWKKGIFTPVFFPAEAEDVDDDAQAPKLAVTHYDAAVVKVATAAQPPELVLKLFEHSGAMGGYRTYKNNVMFLVGDEDQVDRMVEVGRRYLAVHRIIGDPDRMMQFNNEQADKLKKMAEAAELDLRVAITKTYRHFYYPSADASRKAANLGYLLLQPDEQGDIEKDQTEVILRVLGKLEKVLTADQEKPLSPQFVMAKAWPANTVSLTTEDLRRAFAQRLGLKMLLDINQLKRTIKDGVTKGIWIYYPADEGIGYGPPSPAPMVQVGEDATLYTPDEAKRLGIKLKGEETTPEMCPVCKNSPCTCGEDEEDDDKKPKRFAADGAPAQAFQAIADQCRDAKVATLRRLFIRIEGMGKNVARDARSLGLAIPQMGKAGFSLEKKLVLEFASGQKLAVDFAGSWELYKRLKTVTDPLSQEASNASVKLAVRADFEQGLEPGGEQFQTIRDVLKSLEMGKIHVDAEEKGTEAK